MAIKEFQTRTGTETVAEGTLNGIFFNELKEKKDYGKNGKSWIPTHSVNIIVDEDRIGVGLTDKDVLRAKDADGNYHDLVRGQKISVVITSAGEYQGKAQWAGRVSDVIIMEQVAQQQAPIQGQQKASGGFKKDMTGVESGHAINAAIGLLGGEALEDADAVIALAKKFHDLTKKLKEEYSKKFPEVSDYDIGARVGQAVLSATQIVAEFEDIEAVARVTIEQISPAVLEYVQAKPKEEKKPAAVKKTAAKKTPSKKKAEPTPERVEDDNIPSHAFEDGVDDEDVPF